MMEKYDGVRVYWDGKRLHCKNLNISMKVPQQYAFPSTPFEGQLWYVDKEILLEILSLLWSSRLSNEIIVTELRMGYNKQHQCQEFLMKEERNWKEVKIVAFDAPQMTDKPYSERLAYLRQNIVQNHSILSVIQTTMCQGKDHMQAFFQQLCIERPIERQANGIVLRDPAAWYFQSNAFFTQKVTNYNYYFDV
jgi:hypothetical protein